MRSGRLRHRITIQEKGVSSQSSSGEPQYTWVDVVTVWASIEPQSGTEAVRADRETAAVAVVMEMRYRSGITAAMRVTKGQRVWDIESVIDPDMRHRELQLVCVEQPATVGI